MAWLQLIRWKNLLVILLTQLLAWRFVVFPASPMVLDFLNFSCLAISTVLIAAAGYIINDYFDMKIDLVNRPAHVVLDRVIPRRQAIIAHALLNLIALLLAGFTAFSAHHPEWLTLQIACILLLWFYSTDFKRQYMTGNIVVALLAALTIIALIVYEPVMQRDAHLTLIAAGNDSTWSSLPVWVLGIYSGFAFMLTWVREIVKDMEDMDGDAAEGCQTMPIKKSLRYAARFTTVLALVVILALVVAALVLYGYQYRLLSLYVAAFLVLPLITWVLFLQRGNIAGHYHTASSRLKIVMVLGVCSLLIYHFQLIINRG